MTYIDFESEILVFGGRMSAYNFNCRNDTWIFNVNTKEWQSIDSKGPSPRMYTSMIYNSIDEKAILFGGNENPNLLIYDDIWEFNIDTRT